MSEPENTPIPPPPTTPKTAAVPLKKETVRITLRGRPGGGVTQPREATAPVAPAGGSFPAPSLNTTSVVPTIAKKATAPIQLPSAPLPPPAPKSATAPVRLPAPPLAPPSRRTTTAVPVSASPPPSAPAPSSPMPPPARPMAPPAAPSAPGAPPVAAAPRPPGAPAAPRPAAPPMAGLPAATRPLAQNPGAPPPRVETGAPTVPLQKPGAAAPRPPGAPGASTGPMAGGAAPLPKATVKLQPTQAMQRPSISAPPSAPVKRSAAADAEQFYEEKDPEAGLVPLSVICFVFSAVLMAVQMFGSDSVTDDKGAESPLFVPTANKMEWESRNPVTGAWTTNFKNKLPTIP